MSDHGPLIGAAVTTATLAGGVFAVGAFDEKTSTYFTQHWPSCVISSVTGVFLFVGIMFLQSAKRALPPWKVFVGHVMVTALFSAIGPPFQYSYVTTEPKVADQFLIGVFCGLGISVVVMSVDEYLIQRQRDGTLVPLILRTVAGTVGRLAPVSHPAIPVGVDPNRPQTATITRTHVETVEMKNGGRDAAARERIDNLAFGPDQPAVGGGGNAPPVGSGSSGRHRVQPPGGQGGNGSTGRGDTSDGG